MSKSQCINDMSPQEQADVGIPYFVAPADLQALGLDPENYFKTGNVGEYGGWGPVTFSTAKRTRR